MRELVELMREPWTWAVGGVFGAFVGSFLNVVIYRMPRGISLSDPRYSFCPKCRARLGTSDLVPILSWLVLRGKCRYCMGKVSGRYALVELANAALWAGVWHRYVIASFDPATAIAYALAGSTLVAIVFVDWELYIIPDELNAFLWFVGIGLNVWLLAIGDPKAWYWGMPSALAGWLVGVGALWGIALFGRVLFGKDAMGHGDIKMARGIGAVLLPAAAGLSFLIAVALGAILGVAQVLIRGKGEKAPEPKAGGTEQGAEGPSAEERKKVEEVWEPEPLPMLLRSGVGYLACVDIAGLFVPKLYERWFGEPPFVPIEEEEEFEVERTMIPFGPYLALGAIAAIVWRDELFGLVDSYVQWAFPQVGSGEH